METTSAMVTSAEALPSTSASSALSRWTFAVSQRHRYLLDKLLPHVLRRWITFLAIAFAYSLRVYLVEGFYIVTYALGLYMMTLLIGFLSPRVDPELQELMDGPTLPIRGSDEFRPFVRRLPEFKFWLCLMYGFLFGFLLTFFPVFDVPVFWPVLLFYWIAFFTVSMRRQIVHMMKYKYVPFTFGKQTYGKKKSSSANTTANLPKD